MNSHTIRIDVSDCKEAYVYNYKFLLMLEMITRLNLRLFSCIIAVKIVSRIKTNE